MRTIQLKHSAILLSRMAVTKLCSCLNSVKPSHMCNCDAHNRKNAGVAGVDVATDPRAPRLAHVVESEAIQAETGLAYLHSSHCLGSGTPNVLFLHRVG